GDEPAKAAPDAKFIELHPLGRVENCYRWAGETDVFEAIEAVCRQYKIDRDRIVLRGMSMGASGTWHLGLKHPDRFVALGPYCGYVDTHRFSQTPLDNFVKVGPLPEHQERGLHMLDSVDYAANAGVVPAIACMGAQVVASLRDGAVEVPTAKNITRFAILTAELPALPKTLRVGRTELIVPDSITPKSRGVVVAKEDGRWKIAGELGSTPLSGKRP